MVKAKKKRNSYKGLGFVELIISIAVAGVALMVLTNMAANNMREVIRYERHDALTRLAMDGALIVRRQVENANDLRRNDIKFGREGSKEEEDDDYCYKIDFGENLEDSSVDFDFFYFKDNLLAEEKLHTTIIYNNENKLGDVYYVAYCVDSIEVASAGGVIKGYIYVGSVIAGYVDCSRCGIEPYVHNIIVNVKELEFKQST